MSLMEAVLDQYGVHARTDSRWCSIRCINPDHQDDRASARVHVEEGAYICLGCGLKASSPARLIMQIENKTWREASEYLAGLGGNDGTVARDRTGTASRSWTAHRGRKYRPPRGRMRRMGRLAM